MLVIDPTQCGKTHFVKHILKNANSFIEYSEKLNISWFYGQWQSSYAEMEDIRVKFYNGLPHYSEDLHEINSKFCNIIVLDDLAPDSVIVSKLFTRGRHRNASVILMLQNAFPKGKHNKDIARNASYITMFKSPADRRQINILASTIFAKDDSKFMDVYNKVTAAPYGSATIECHPLTTSDKQVVSNVMGDCRYFPGISSLPQTMILPTLPESNRTPWPQKRKADLPVLQHTNFKRMRHTSNSNGGPLLISKKKDCDTDIFPSNAQFKVVVYRLSEDDVHTIYFPKHSKVENSNGRLHPTCGLTVSCSATGWLMKLKDKAYAYVELNCNEHLASIIT